MHGVCPASCSKIRVVHTFHTFSPSDLPARRLIRRLWHEADVAAVAPRRVARRTVHSRHFQNDRPKTEGR